MKKRFLILFALLLLALAVCLVSCDKSDTVGGQGGNTDTGNTDGGSTEGGNTEGGSTEGGDTEGGNTEGGDVHTHDFTVKALDCKYLKGEGEFYYSCACGEKGDTAFTSEDAPIHDYGKDYEANATHVFLKCGGCGEIKDKKEHSLRFEKQSDGTAKVTGLSANAAEVIIPAKYDGNTVNAIAADAFKMKITVTSVTFPATITSVGAGAFNNCMSIEAVYVSDLGAWAGIAFENQSANPLSYADAFYIDGEALGDALVLGEGVTAVGSFAFAGCAKITSVSFPSTITKIGKGAFTGCSALKKVYLADLAAWCGIDFPDVYATPLVYASELYLGGELIVDLVIPLGVKVIHPYAFYNCQSIKNVTLSKTTTTVSTYAFMNCTALDTFFFASSIQRIEKEAFKGCMRIDHFEYEGNMKSWRKLDKEEGWSSGSLYSYIQCQDGRPSKN